METLEEKIKHLQELADAPSKLTSRDRAFITTLMADLEEADEEIPDTALLALTPEYRGALLLLFVSFVAQLKS